MPSASGVEASQSFVGQGVCEDPGQSGAAA
jgi:hypothetical protein